MSVVVPAVANTTAPVLALIAWDTRRGGALSVLSKDVQAPVWGLEYDTAGRQLVAGCSDALHTFTGVVNAAAGTVSSLVSTPTGDMAFALAHTFDQRRCVGDARCCTQA